jgi:hypothetical protein
VGFTQTKEIVMSLTCVFSIRDNMPGIGWLKGGQPNDQIVIDARVWHEAAPRCGTPSQEGGYVIPSPDGLRFPAGEIDSHDFASLIEQLEYIRDEPPFDAYAPVLPWQMPEATRRREFDRLIDFVAEHADGAQVQLCWNECDYSEAELRAAIRAERQLRLVSSTPESEKVRNRLYSRLDRLRLRAVD